MTFKDYFAKSNKNNVDKIVGMKIGTKKRHHHAIGRSGINRKHREFVPDMHQPDMGSFAKLDNLRKGKTGTKVLSPSELNKLKQRFNIGIILPGEVKKLGNTGISVYFDKQTNRYMMQR